MKKIIFGLILAIVVMASMTSCGAEYGALEQERQNNLT